MRMASSSKTAATLAFVSKTKKNLAKRQVDRLVEALAAVDREHLLSTVTDCLKREQHVERFDDRKRFWEHCENSAAFPDTVNALFDYYVEIAGH